MCSNLQITETSYEVPADWESDAEPERENGIIVTNYEVINNRELDEELEQENENSGTGTAVRD